ncbi:MAG: VCBS repeat-containing protein [Rhodothermia bacterium]|nr:VCBS repeat-containing protein [Rhodothermia bacterium]
MKYLSLFVLSCLASVNVAAQSPLFKLLPPEKTGITFQNTLVEKPGLNIMEIATFYNGAGVSVGDLNNDGLPEVFFTSNMGQNKLYLNKGNLVFEDITKTAGVAGKRGWKAGVTMADVNNDGWLDVYVSYGADVDEPLRRNELYINQQNLTFTEKAAEFGLADFGHGTQAHFFDFDRDGDLDVFVLNQMVKNYQYFDVAYMKRAKDPLAGDRLYRNDNGKFTDVSDYAGIIANPIGAGLSAAVSDFDLDGWPDLYVCNDYDEDDYLYINQKDGTFKEELRNRLGHTTKNSMGSDVGDINNDGYPDFFAVDMLPEDNRRQKILKGPDMYDFVQMLLSHGYHPQYMRNMLQLNNGRGEFQEIGQLAGVSNTDWSWSPLFADFDRDGWQDLFITNGYLRDYTDLDFLRYKYGEARRKAQLAGQEVDLFSLVKEIPSSDVKNYLFQNQKDLRFQNMRDVWGLNQNSVSSGAAYADLDNDGDLDLVVNNINQVAFVYQNLASEQGLGRYLKVKFEGFEGNRFGIGAKVTLNGIEKKQLFVKENYVERGYQSSVEPSLYFGLGNLEKVNLEVLWPNGKIQKIANVPTNQTLVLKQADADLLATETPKPELSFSFTVVERGIDFIHAEDDFNDFKREALLPKKRSKSGPTLASADVNGDGRIDVFVGGAKGQVSALYVQQPDGTFLEKQQDALGVDADLEDVDALFLDVDQDGDADLYVVSGGNDVDADESGFAPAYQDRLYLNDGSGNLAKTALPKIQSCGGEVAAADVDGDGDLDLFRTGLSFSGRYPLEPRSFLLENQNGAFVDVTPEELKHIGMASSAVWADIDHDQTPELLVAGEWMPIRVFKIETGWTATELTEKSGFAMTNGWWNTLIAADMDGDGDLDLVAGNQGLNNQMKPSLTEPMTLVAGDFDENGSVDPIISYYIQGKSYPMPSRDELLDQLAPLRRFFTTFASYSNATIQDFLSVDQRQKAYKKAVYTFSSTLFENDGKGHFSAIPLPKEAQFAPINTILVKDLNQDGLLDLILGGNNYHERAQTGYQNALHGLILLGDAKERFRVITSVESGFHTPLEIRDLNWIQTEQGTLLLAGINNKPVKTWQVKTYLGRRN